VVNYNSGTVIPIRAATNKAGRAIKVGGRPFALAITPDGKTAYLTGSQVTPIRTASSTALKAIASLVRPAPLALGGAGTTPQNAAVAARLLAGDPVTEGEQAGWPR